MYRTSPLLYITENYNVSLMSHQVKMLDAMASCKYVVVDAAPRRAGRTFTLNAFMDWEINSSDVPLNYLLLGSGKDLRLPDEVLRQCRELSYGHFQHRNGSQIKYQKFGTNFEGRRDWYDVVISDPIMNHEQVEYFRRFHDYNEGLCGIQRVRIDPKEFLYGPSRKNEYDKVVSETYQGARYVIVSDHHASDHLVEHFVYISSQDDVAFVTAEDMRNDYLTGYYAQRTHLGI